jgi:hypothetical protein
MNPDLARELSLAESALQKGDKKHAATHAAFALALDPSDRRALALVDTLLDEKPSFLARVLPMKKDVAPLFPDDGWFGNVAVRARAHFRQNNLDEAFSLVAQIQLRVPHVDYHGWLTEIVDVAEKRGHVLDAAILFNVFGRVGEPTIGVLKLRAGEVAYVAPWATLLERVCRMHLVARTERAATLAMAASGLLRRAGRCAEAISILDAVENRDDNLEVQRGLALRGLGRFEDAASCFVTLHHLVTRAPWIRPEVGSRIASRVSDDQ